MRITNTAITIVTLSISSTDAFSITSTPKGSSHATAQRDEWTSFLSPLASNNILDIQQSSRYGGRPTPSQNIIRTEHKEPRAILGFDLNMISRSFDSDTDTETKPSSKNTPSPIKKQICENLLMEQEAHFKSNFLSEQQLESEKIMSRSEIQEMKVVELKNELGERNLPKTGNKKELQERLIEWTNNQQRRALERNAMNTSHHILTDVVQQSLYTEAPTPAKSPEDEIEPLINRRKELLRSKKFSFSKSKSSLGFDVDEIDEDEVDLTESLNMSSSYLSELTKTFEKKDVKHSTPNNYELKQWYQNAKYADQDGDLVKARYYLEKLMEVTPNDTRVIRRMSRLEASQGNTSEAKQILVEAINRNKSQRSKGDLLQGLAKLEAEQGNRQKARILYKEAIEVAPDFPNPYHALATLEHSEGNIRVATTILRAGLKHCPSNHRLYHALGDLYREAKMLDMAEKAYNKGLKCIDAEAEETGRLMDWGKSFLYTALSHVSYDKGDISECRNWLRQSVKMATMHSQGWLGLAQLEETQHQIAEARNIYEKAVDVYESSRGIGSFSKTVKPARQGDKWVHVYYSWARLEEGHGDYDAANNVYSRAAAAFHGDWDLLTRWAEFQIKFGRSDRARKLFQIACDKVGEKSGKPYRLYAEFEMRSGNYEAARDILFLGAQTISTHNDDSIQQEPARLYHTWAIAEWHLGNLDRAEVLFDHSLRQLPSDSTGSENRALVLYSIARFLYYARNDCYLAQHCIGLSLTESLTPSGDSGIWRLWAKVASTMANENLEQQCLDQAQKLENETNNLDDAPFDLNMLQLKNQMLRRAPWQHKLPSHSSSTNESWYQGLSFPSMEGKEVAHTL